MNGFGGGLDYSCSMLDESGGEYINTDALMHHSTGELMYCSTGVLLKGVLVCS